MTSSFSTWKQKAIIVLKGTPNSKPIINIFCRGLDFIISMDWQGACHGSSCILYILLKEQNIDSTICTGEASFGGFSFNHSWIEIDNEVYDVAIAKTLVEGIEFSPVLRGLDLMTGKSTRLKYGVKTGLEDDEGAILFKTSSFTNYMDNFPNHPEGLWGLTYDIGRALGLQLKAEEIREKYNDVERNIIT